MKNKRRKLLTSVIPIMMIIVAFCQCCGFIDWSKPILSILSIDPSGEEYPTYILDEVYKIDRTNVLLALQQGKKDTFHRLPYAPLSPISVFSITHSGMPVDWKQSDIFFIVKSLNDYIWKEPSDGWLLKYMEFSLPCANISFGPQDFRIVFIKSQRKLEDSFRIERIFSSYDDDNRIFVSETEYHPVHNSNLGIDLTKVKIPVEEALRIAEQNGGAQFRKETGNSCFIKAEMDQNDHDYWLIIYTRYGHVEKTFRAVINASTGEYKEWILWGD